MWNYKNDTFKPTKNVRDPIFSAVSSVWKTPFSTNNPCEKGFYCSQSVVTLFFCFFGVLFTICITTVLLLCAFVVIVTVFFGLICSKTWLISTREFILVILKNYQVICKLYKHLSRIPEITQQFRSFHLKISLPFGLNKMLQNGQCVLRVGFAQPALIWQTNVFR